MYNICGAGKRKKRFFFLLFLTTNAIFFFRQIALRCYLGVSEREMECDSVKRG